MEIEVVKDPARLAADAALAAQLDALGERSAEAQNLGRAITSTALFVTPASVQQQQTLYIARDERTRDAFGFLKSGVKHLFYVNKKGEYSEMDPLCVLDFYVDAAHQRARLGLQLFNRLLQVRSMHHMRYQQKLGHINTQTLAVCHLLQTEQVEPHQLAYDRPSPKLFAFLKKHCGLTDFFPQPNNFVVFDDYFAEQTPEQKSPRDYNNKKNTKEATEV